MTVVTLRVWVRETPDTDTRLSPSPAETVTGRAVLCAVTTGVTVATTTGFEARELLESLLPLLSSSPPLLLLPSLPLPSFPLPSLLLLLPVLVLLLALELLLRSPRVDELLLSPSRLRDVEEESSLLLDRVEEVEEGSRVIVEDEAPLLVDDSEG